MAAREDVMQALFALLSATGEFVTKTRRNRSPENFGPDKCPAFILTEGDEDGDSKSPALPTVRTMNAMAIFYNDVGADENAIPSAALNNVLDAVDAALAPASGSTGRCTLGGLVFSVAKVGKTYRSPGDVTGKAAAIVSIAIRLP